MATATTDVRAVILAGGAGTRFWPASRRARPKQLLPLTGGGPMISETIDRVLPLTDGWSSIYVAGGRATEAATRALLPRLPGPNLLVEPMARNTAPCIAWAAAVVARSNPDAIVVVLPSDHHVADVPGFRAALETAIASAQEGRITTLGIRPSRPDTGFGYIEMSPGAGPVLDVIRFVEKPDKARAEAFVAGGRHLWNAGMFIFRARDMLAAVRAHLVPVADAVARLDLAAAEGREGERLEEEFLSMPSVSIDFGVMEKLERLAVVPASFGWSDVGSWEAAWQLASKDDDENSGPEHARVIDGRRNHVVDLRSDARPGSRLIALLGVDDLCLIETDDATLLIPRERCQDVRLLVDWLKANRPELL
ncbi:MAG: NTP transferase domain-containing protein [Myxococcales bacterium]|nr:NTP transferase domain-containing protein [Myxococcales bacterium]